ncbi:MAG: DUF3108 domain-containing protein [Candidatus Latescibacteria bacterium]|nr:DUF3108 domain-containing protein [Candidatus Latescibacterota bacterium]
MNFLLFCLLPDMGEAQEVYRYTITYTGIPVGHTIVGIAPVPEYDGRQVYRLTVDSETNRFASTLFKVNNRYETTVDLDSSTSLQFKAIVQQSNLSQEVIIVYDHKKGRAFRNGRPAYSIPKGVSDLFGAMFLVSKRIKKVGETCEVMVDLGGVFCRVVVDATAVEKIRLPVGPRRAIRAKTVFEKITGDSRHRQLIDLLTNRLSKEGVVLVLWFSDDGRGTLLKASYGKRPFFATAELTRDSENSPYSHE